MDHPALGVIIPGLVEAACQSVLEAAVLGIWGREDDVSSDQLGPWL